MHIASSSVSPFLPIHSFPAKNSTWNVRAISAKYRRKKFAPYSEFRMPRHIQSGFCSRRYIYNVKRSFRTDSGEQFESKWMNRKSVRILMQHALMRINQERHDFSEFRLCTYASRLHFNDSCIRFASATKKKTEFPRRWKKNSDKFQRESLYHRSAARNNNIASTENSS